MTKEPYSGEGYLVTEIYVDPTWPATCGSCDWEGLCGALEPIEDCALDPGDPSPAGRCPEADCGCLAYVNKPATAG